jgi:hypothetical protein
MTQGSFMMGLVLTLLVAGCGFQNGSGSIFDTRNDNDTRCSFDNARYAQGTTLCRSGRQVRCKAGHWKDLGSNCAHNDAATCTFNSRSYASGKASCQSGKRYRCQDGAWRNTGNSCKG